VYEPQILKHQHAHIFCLFLPMLPKKKKKREESAAARWRFKVCSPYSRGWQRVHEVSTGHVMGQHLKKYPQQIIVYILLFYALFTKVVQIYLPHLNSN
jgi:hypothetical protein